MKLRVIALLCGLSAAALAQEATPQARLVNAARKQVGVTVTYDPEYVVLAYPNGDVPQDRGVCSDVVIRALRASLDIDLQKLVHEDMKAHFSIYPRNWGLSSTDKNIDHRRVPNLQTWFKRHGQSFEATNAPADYLPGDIVTCLVAGNLPHVMIVSDLTNGNGVPLVIHNIGHGAQEEDRLFEFPLTGHYRLDFAKLTPPAAVR
ncbi:MAG: DUF1287 domain-containing protein [Chthoniobacterales bacterium]